MVQLSGWLSSPFQRIKTWKTCQFFIYLIHIWTPPKGLNWPLSLSLSVFAILTFRPFTNHYLLDSFLTRAKWRESKLDFYFKSTLQGQGWSAKKTIGQKVSWNYLCNLVVIIQKCWTKSYIWSKIVEAIKPAVKGGYPKAKPGDLKDNLWVRSF